MPLLDDLLARMNSEPGLSEIQVLENEFIFHDASENIFPSKLTGDLLANFGIVMAEIKQFMDV